MGPCSAFNRRRAPRAREILKGAPLWRGAPFATIAGHIYTTFAEASQSEAINASQARLLVLHNEGLHTTGRPADVSPRVIPGNARAGERTGRPAPT